MDAAQTGPGKRTELAGDLVRVERTATFDEPAAGPLGQADDRMGERQLVLGIDPGVDQRGDRCRRLGRDLAHGCRELLVLSGRPAVQQHEGVAGISGLNQSDGMHPTAAGVDVMVKGLLPKVEELIARVRAAK